MSCVVFVFDFVGVYIQGRRENSGNQKTQRRCHESEQTLAQICHDKASEMAQVGINRKAALLTASEEAVEILVHFTLCPCILQVSPNEYIVKPDPRY